MVTPIDQLNMGLLPMRSTQPRGMDTMGSSLLGVNVSPVNVQSQLAAAAQPTALGRVRGALGKSLSDPNILRGIAAGLLTGPQRTPVSFGQSLLGGLQAGQQMKEAEEERRLKQGLLQREMDLATRKLELEEAKFQPDFQKGKRVNVLLPSGKTVFGIERETGEVFVKGPDGQLIPAPEGSTGIGVSVQSQTLGGLSPKGMEKIQSDFLTKVAATENLVLAGNKYLKALAESPDAVTRVGALASNIGAIKADFKAAANALGINTEEGYEQGGVKFGFETEHFDKTFTNLGITSDVLKSQILDLAYLAAASRGQEGRGLSDRDVEKFAKIIGGSGSAESRAATLRSFLDTATKGLIQDRERLIETYGSGLALTPISDRLNIYRPQPTNVDTGLSPEVEAALKKHGSTNGDN
jgi:hypothetical protein